MDLNVEVSARWARTSWSRMEEFDPFEGCTEAVVVERLERSVGDPPGPWRTRVELVVCNTEHPLCEEDLEVADLTLEGVSADGPSLALAARWQMTLVEPVDLGDEDALEALRSAISDCLCVKVCIPHKELEARGIDRALLLEAPGDEAQLELGFEDWLGLNVGVRPLG